jgi:hypothetical protein
MNTVSALLLGVLSLLAAGDSDEDTILPLRYAKGRVLDVFDSKRC